MKEVWFRSLQAQLVLRLAAALVVATVLAVSALVYEGTQPAQGLGDDEMEHRAVTIAHFVTQGPDGTLHLSLPAKLDQIYHSPARTQLLAVRNGDGPWSPRRSLNSRPKSHDGCPLTANEALSS